jgi:hypothetical protein
VERWAKDQEITEYFLCLLRAERKDFFLEDIQRLTLQVSDRLREFPNDPLRQRSHKGLLEELSKQLSIAAAKQKEETITVDIVFDTTTFSVSVSRYVLKQFWIPGRTTFGASRKSDCDDERLTNLMLHEKCVYNCLVAEMKRQTGHHICVFVFVAAPTDGSHDEPVVFDNTGGTFEDLQHLQTEPNGRVCVQALAVDVDTYNQCEELYHSLPRVSKLASKGHFPSGPFSIDFPTNRTLLTYLCRLLSQDHTASPDDFNSVYEWFKVFNEFYVPIKARGNVGTRYANGSTLEKLKMYKGYEENIDTMEQELCQRITENPDGDLDPVYLDLAFHMKRTYRDFACLLVLLKNETGGGKRRRTE